MSRDTYMRSSFSENQHPDGATAPFAPEQFPAYRQGWPAESSQEGGYAFEENGKAIHVGRSDRMPDRIREHGAASSRHESATFAYKLMLEKLGEQGGHASPFTRREFQDLHSDEYQRQKQRIREMDVRAVAIEDQAVQAVFEIYAILALSTTEYNSFQAT